MPEGDTIHYAALRIRAVLEHRVPAAILTPHPRHGAAHWPERLAGRGVRAVDAHGKHLFVRFDEGLTLHSHLRMTGAWDLHREGASWRRSAGRAWLVMRARGWEIVQFDGPVLELVADARLRSDPRIARLGPDIIGESFDTAGFLHRLRTGDRTRAIGEALLDQRVLAGLGTVWRAETCWALALDPWRPVARVADEEAGSLAAWAHEHMSICARGGFSARPHAVYRRSGRPCPRCGAAIRGRGMGEENRIVYWCPGCQR